MDFENNKIIFIGTLILVLAVNVYMFMQEKECKDKLKKSQKKIKKLKQNLGIKDKHTTSIGPEYVTFSDDYNQKNCEQQNPVEYNTVPSL